MRIGIIGSGMIGGTAARLFVGAGHDVVIANRRSPEKLQALADELGAKLRPGSVDQAATFADVVLVAIPFGSFDQLPAGPFSGKIVVDADNYYPDRDGHVPALDADEVTSSELLAQRLPGARVVKAFNTMYYATLASAGDLDKPDGERLALFVAGDDTQAKAVVGCLIDELGFAAVDTGSLAEGGRKQQPGSAIYAADLAGADARAALAG